MLAEAWPGLAWAGPSSTHPRLVHRQPQGTAPRNSTRPVRLRPLALQHPARGRRQAGRWNEWYREAIPLAEQRYETYLKERTEQEGSQP